MSDLDFEIIDGCGICGDLGHNAWECPNQKGKTMTNREQKQDIPQDNVINGGSL